MEDGSKPRNRPGIPHGRLREFGWRDIPRK